MDTLINFTDRALRTLFAPHQSARPMPGTSSADASLNQEEKALSGALMRVNHVGEVCAQALYTGQALATANPVLKAQLSAACAEETDHLAWTEARLKALGARPSLLNPLWYAGAFAIGWGAAKLGGDRVSLGFVVETERQVEAHLQGHLAQLPENDTASRAVVAQMKADEAEHARAAQHAGAMPLPAPAQWAMRAAAKVMTTVAHRI